jgi:hypothetical protein
LDDPVVYLVPLGPGRFELYSEPPDDHASDAPPRGWMRERLRAVQERWRDTVQAARRNDPSATRLARWRDWAVCRVAEMLAEQRTLWALRHATSATLVHPSDLTDTAAAATRDQILQRARRHHGIWAIGDGLLFAASGLLVLVPGPNVIAYYIGVRLLGHVLSWRGARRALTRTTWNVRAEPALAELGQLVDVPRAARASRVAAIAASLKLPRLAAFFDRAAITAR